MLRSDVPLDYKKALVAGGAAIGLGLIVYRLWPRRQPASSRDRPRARNEVSPAQKIKEDVQTHVSTQSSGVHEPSTDKKEVFTSLAGKETVSLTPDVVAADVLSTSGTFVKVSPSASPVSFEEIGASYVEPMSMPSTPPLILEPSGLKPGDSTLTADDISMEAMNSSSMSFIAISAAPSEGSSLQAEPSEVSSETNANRSDGNRSDGSVVETEKNDIIVIETSSDHSSGSEDAERALKEQEQPVDNTGTESAVESSESGATVNTIDPVKE